MFGKSKYTGECKGYYTGEGVMDGRRFNKNGGQLYDVNGVQVEAYFLTSHVHADNNMRFPVYEYEVNGVIYKRARVHISFDRRTVEKMRGKPCRVLYDTINPGDSRVK